MPNNYLMNEMFLRNSSISNGSTVSPQIYRLRICGYGCQLRDCSAHNFGLHGRSWNQSLKDIKRRLS